MRDKPRRLSRARRVEMTELFVQRMAAAMPEPRCELTYSTPYQLLVSVILSAQTTDKMVNRCMEPLYAAGFTPQKVIKMGAAGLLKHIRSIGLAPTKSKNVHAMTGQLLANHKGQVPATREELEALPGVGRKTANVILGEIFGQPTLAVDTHCFRVSRRLGLHDEPTPLKCELKLLDLFDPSHLPAAHHWLILHGRYTCKAQRPLCDDCAMRDVCPSH